MTCGCEALRQCLAVHRVANHQEMPARDMVQGAQCVMPFEVPAAVAEDPIIRLGGNHLSQKQVLLLMIGGLWQQSTFQPRHAALEHRSIDQLTAERLQTISLELVLALALGQFQA